MTLFRDFLVRKHRLAVDMWGTDDSQVRQICQPPINRILEEIPEHRHLYPWPVRKLADRISRLSRNILIAEFLVQSEWADRFKGLTKEEIRDLAWDFSFENCLHRGILNKVLRENATQPD